MMQDIYITNKRSVAIFVSQFDSDVFRNLSETVEVVVIQWHAPLGI
jgi:hypothetical protein